MGLPIILFALAFTAYFVESIFGFGGTVIFLGATSFLHDFKDIVYIGVYLGLVSMSIILVQSYAAVNVRHVAKILLLTLPGMILGAAVFKWAASDDLLKGFSCLLILYGLQSLLLPTMKIHKYAQYAFVVLGGFVHGLFSTGGPFIIMGYRDFFANKTELRASMAAMFFVGNIIRIAQDSWMGGQAFTTSLTYWWMGLPVILAAVLGYRVHKVISDTTFKTLMNVIMVVIGFILLLR